jgi:hypothetical protein
MKQGTQIEMVKEYYSRTDSGKSWKAQPDTVEKTIFTREQYDNYTDPAAIRFFRRLGGIETVTKCYTQHGYIPVQITSTSPDRQEKRVARFIFN